MAMTNKNDTNKELNEINNDEELKRQSFFY